MVTKAWCKKCKVYYRLVGKNRIVRKKKQNRILSCPNCGTVLMEMKFGLRVWDGIND